RDDPAAPLSGLDHRPEQLALLLVAERGRFPRGARHDDGIRSRREQVVGQLLGSLQIQAVIVAERRDHGGEQRSESAWHRGSLLGADCITGLVAIEARSEPSMLREPCRASTRRLATTEPPACCTADEGRRPTRARRRTAPSTRRWPAP